MVWKGVILEESLEDKSLLKLVKIVGTKTEKLEKENRIMTFHGVEIECAFASLKRKARAHVSFKNKVTIYLDNDLLKMIDKRAKKNMLTLPEQIEDILRRSCLSLKKKPLISGKIDDLLVSIFSRQQRRKK